jgi:hypothetical protein
MALLLIALFALTATAVFAAQSPEPAQSAQTAADAVPVNGFFRWAAWTEQTPSNNFDLARCRTVEVGDADGDGLDDLVCAYNYGGATTRTFIQFSRTTQFTRWTNQHPNALTQFELDLCTPLLSGDVDGDGRLDLVCTYDYGSGSTATFVQRASGAGATGWAAWYPKTPNSTFNIDWCRDLQIGDANDDGYDDLLCAYNYGGATARTFIQYSTGASFGGWAAQPGPQNQFELNNCRPLLSGDLNGDGRTDLICPYDYGLNTRTFVQIAPGPGETGFTTWRNWTGDGNSQFDLDRCTNGVQVGDVNGDGNDDLVCAYNYGGATTRTFVQLSSGADFTTWTSQHPTLIDQFELNNCRPLLTGDLNADGRTDLICPYDYGLNTRTFVQIAPGPGEASFTTWRNWTGDGNNQFDLDRCAGIQVGNLNGDGLDDLACAYDYGSASTRTFVQLAERYRLALPAVLR